MGKKKVVAKKKEDNRIELLEEFHQQIKNITILQQQLRMAQGRVNELSNLLDAEKNGKRDTP